MGGGGNDSNWVNADATLNPLDPNVVKVAELFSVPLKTIADIDEFAKGIELVMAHNSHMRSDKPSDLGLNGQLGKSTSFSNVSILVMALHSDETPIFQSVSIHEKSSSFVDVAGAAISEPSKPRVNFCSLSLENLCQWAEFSIPTMVVKKVFSEDGVTVPPKVVTPTIVTPIVENP
ncbi:hypothetical protein Tco_1542752, partial [Tanacetum coccineum]